MPPPINKLSCELFFAQAEPTLFKRLHSETPPWVRQSCSTGPGQRCSSHCLPGCRYEDEEAASNPKASVDALWVDVRGMDCFATCRGVEMEALVPRSVNVPTNITVCAQSVGGALRQGGRLCFCYHSLPLSSKLSEGSIPRASAGQTGRKQTACWLLATSCIYVIKRAPLLS